MHFIKMSTLYLFLIFVVIVTTGCNLEMQNLITLQDVLPGLLLLGQYVTLFRTIYASKSFSKIMIIIKALPAINLMQRKQSHSSSQH